MRGIVNPDKNIRNTVTNDLWNPREEEIAELGDYYWEKHKKRFRPRSGQDQTYPPVLMKPQIKLLSGNGRSIPGSTTRTIKLSSARNTNRYVMSPADVEQLKEYIRQLKTCMTFQVSTKYTNNIRNYYDGAHYRPCLGRQLLDSIYATHEPTY